MVASRSPRTQVSSGDSGLMRRHVVIPWLRWYSGDYHGGLAATLVADLGSMARTGQQQRRRGETRVSGLQQGRQSTELDWACAGGDGLLRARVGGYDGGLW
jgi:hypothetical protein